MSSATLYGIKNCDTVKKARKWLDANSVPYTFHDFRVDGIDKTLINNFLKQLDLESLINKRGTTWRKLSAQEKEIKNKNQTIALIIDNPTIIKRPVLDVNKTLTLGFSEESYKSIKF
jgi:arsenate reductase